MTDRLFPLDDIPEVPLFRPPRVSRGAQISDERLSHDYPPEWHCCQTCKGDGFGAKSGDLLVERGHASIARSPGQGGNWVQVTHKPTGVTGYADGHESGLRNVEDAYRTVRQQLRAKGIVCPDCLGMGSVKAMVRLLAGHRCERCGHPYMPKSDAKMLGVEPTPYHWSPCDPRCTHFGPIRWREVWPPGGLPHGEHPYDYGYGDQPWKYQNLDEVGERAGDGIIDRGPSGEPIERYEVEAEWRILTVHHLDGDKANLAWWNLAALCQRCHLEIQAKVVLERVYPHEHSDWFKPHAAGWYAKAYLGLDLSRAEVEARMDELLALERTPA